MAMMRERYLGWFVVGVLISVAGAVGFAVATRVRQRQEAGMEPMVRVPEEEPVPVA
ncbi:MAG TPA: hypothetical protein VFM55_06595 [Micromonosporaceae bacterium]|nr:hypothetical protein [Micromonosporaceae bacterium]